MAREFLEIFSSACRITPDHEVLGPIVRFLRIIHGRNFRTKSQKATRLGREIGSGESPEDLPVERVHDRFGGHGVPPGINLRQGVERPGDKPA